jgi:hypothetical protein
MAGIGQDQSGLESRVAVLDCHKEAEIFIIDSSELLKFDKVNASLTKFTL